MCEPKNVSGPQRNRVPTVFIKKRVNFNNIFSIDIFTKQWISFFEKYFFIKQVIFNNIVSIEKNKKSAFTHYVIVGPMNLGYMFLKWSSLHQTDVRCYHIHICYLSLSNIPPFSSRQNLSKIIIIIIKC